MRMTRAFSAPCKDAIVVSSTDERAMETGQTAVGNSRTAGWPVGIGKGEGRARAGKASAEEQEFQANAGS